MATKPIPPSAYDRLKKSTSSKVYKFIKKIGEKNYDVLTGLLNIMELKLAPVDSRNRTGNPRFWNIHRKMLQKNPNCGPMTESQQIRYFQTGEVEGFEDDKPDNVVKSEFKNLGIGLKTSGESQDDIHVDCNGFVIEGNRRTAFCKLNYLEDSRFEKVRVVCYPENVATSDVLTALARMHVSQKAQWTSGDKIEVLRELRDTYKMPIEKIANQLGVSVRTAELYVRSGDILKRYQEETKDFRPDKFTMFYKVAGNPKLRKMMLPDNIVDGNQDESFQPGLWENFKDWVKNDKIKDCRHVPELISKQYNLLGNRILVKTISEKGTTEAINLARDLKNNNEIPGVEYIKNATLAISNISGIEASEKYRVELLKYISELQSAFSQKFGNESMPVAILRNQ